MMEQPDPGKRHDHAVLVRRGDDLIVPDGTAGLGNVLNTGLPGPLHVVPEGEEGVAAHGDAGDLCEAQRKATRPGNSCSIVRVTRS